MFVVRTVGLLGVWILLVVFGCRKTLVQPIEEKPVAALPKEESVPAPSASPDPEPPKPLFKIGGQLGARAGVCEDGTCSGVALDVEKSSVGFVEGIILNGIVFRDNALVINNSGLAENLTGWVYGLFKSQKAIIGIPLVLEHPDEEIQDLTFKVAVTGVTPAMQLGVYDGLYGKRKGLKDLKGFTRTNVFKVQPAVKAVQGTYYILLHLSLEEVKGMYDKVKGGTEIRFKVIGTAKGYSEDIETIDVRLE